MTPYSPDVAALIIEHHILLKNFRHRDAKILLQQALVRFMDEAPFSLDVSMLLDALALGCKEMEEFSEAGVYLAQSLAIKKMIFGPTNSETEIAVMRLAACRKVENIKDLFYEENREDLFATERGRRKDSTLVRCLVSKKTYDGYVVSLPDDNRMGHIISFCELEPGEEVYARIAGIRFGVPLLHLPQKYALVRNRNNEAFGQPHH
ncbi:MAG: hypothetical protein K2Z81_14055 [Cyanobacteria bacterium]|nr:hypothetical protein [Cyanobacteriota bacterium]